MGQSSRVVGMKMGQDHLADISRRDTHRAQLRPKLFFWMYRELDRPLIKRMPRGGIAALMHARSLSRVDHNQPLVMLNQPCMNREPRAPLRVIEHVGNARQSVAPPFHLRS